MYNVHIARRRRRQHAKYNGTLRFANVTITHQNPQFGVWFRQTVMLSFPLLEAVKCGAFVGVCVYVIQLHHIACVYA